MYDIDKITTWLKNNVFRNEHIAYDITDEKLPLLPYGDIGEADILDVIASLHNLLYEQITGERYDYMFHWANKLGLDCIDDMFDADCFKKEESE